MAGLNNVDKNATAELNELKGITLCSLNVRGLYSKMEEVHLLLSRSQVDVLLLNETFLNNGYSDAELAINGYYLYRLDRDENIGKKGGGVAAYCSTTPNITEVDNLSICTRDAELL